MRVFIGGLATETNTFSPIPTGRRGFEEYGVSRQTSLTGEGPFAPILRAFRRTMEAQGHEVIESLSAFAQPAGPTLKAVYEELRDAILGDLAAAGPVDVVLLGLHGAMVAQGYDDCEGDLIGRARRAAPGAVIGVELDPHCHLTDAMVEGADLIVIAREYPHTDFGERAGDLARLCLRAAAGEIRPVAALLDCRMIGFFPTGDEPMQSIVEEFRAASAAEGMVTAEMGHGFPWGDVAEVGTKVLVYADGSPERAEAEARRLGALIYDNRIALSPPYPDLIQSLDRARGLNGTVVLGDFADNPGGGAPGDSTFVLQALLERGVTDAVVGAFCDPGAAELCCDAGVGAVLPIRLGGKMGTASGDPLDLEVEVMGAAEAHSCGVFGARQPLGRSAWVRARGIDIVICSVRTQTYEPDAFTGLGVPLEGRRLVVVKSSNHYRAGFEPDADHIWSAATPGTMSLDFGKIPYTRLQRAVFPMDADPWASEGPPAPQRFGRAARRGG